MTDSRTPKQDGQTIDEILSQLYSLGYDSHHDFYGTKPIAEAKQALLTLFSEIINEVIGEDYPTPNDGRVDSVVEPHYRHLRWQQHLRKEQLLQQLEAK